MPHHDLELMSAAAGGPDAGVTVWSPDTCLLTALSRHLLSLPTENLPQTCVVLPTERMTRWVQAMMTEARPAFLAPVFCNMESFLSRTAGQMPAAGTPSLRRADSATVQLILSSLLATGRWKHLRLGHEHEIAQIAAEAGEWLHDVDLDARFAEIFAGNLYRSEATIDTLAERTVELTDLLRELHLRLEEAGLMLARDYTRVCSAGIARALEAGDALPWRMTWFAGFTSLPSCHHPLLRALAERPDVHLWFSAPPVSRHQDQRNPLQELLSAACAVMPPVRQGPRAAAASGSTTLRAVVRTSNIAEEAAAAVGLIRDGLAAGIPPHRMAILVTDERRYGPPLQLALAGGDLKPNFAIASPVTATPAGSWLQALFDLLLGDQPVGAVIDFLCHPVTRDFDHQQTGSHRGDPRGDIRGDDQPNVRGDLPGDMREKICHAAVRAGIATGFPAIMTGLRQTLAGKSIRTWISAVDEAVSVLLPGMPDTTAGESGIASVSDEPRPLKDWVQKIASVVEAFGLTAVPASAGDPDHARRESAARSLAGFLALIRSAAVHLITPVRAHDAWMTLQPLFLALEARTWGDQLRGLQILKVEEARYIPFDLVVLTGAAEGFFPASLPQDSLLDNWLKTRAGFPGWRFLQAIEEDTFRLLHARLPRLAMTWPGDIDGTPSVRSRFAGQLLLETGTGRTPASASREFQWGDFDEAVSTLGLQSPADAPRLRPPPDCGTFTGDCREILATLSPSRAGDLIECPYKYLLKALGVDETALPEEGDKLVEGTWLHGILEAFFSGAYDGQQWLPPIASLLRDDTGPEAFRSLALERLDILTRRIAPPAARSSLILRQLRHFSWPAFVDYLLAIYKDQPLTRITLGIREKKVGPVRIPVVTNGPGSPAAELLVSGTVDATEFTAGAVVITDYKRNSHPNGADVRLGVAPQLLLYAEALAATSAAATHISDAPADPPAASVTLAEARLGYFSILRGRHQFVAAGSALHAAGKAGNGKGRQTTLEEAMGRFRANLAFRLGEMLAADGTSRFVPDPSRCTWCSFAGICRKDDAAIATRLEPRLKKFLDGAACTENEDDTTDTDEDAEGRGGSP